MPVRPAMAETGERDKPGRRAALSAPAPATEVRAEAAPGEAAEVAGPEDIPLLSPSSERNPA